MTPFDSHTITIEKGTILVYRIFDIGDEIDLVQVERILREHSRHDHSGRDHSGGESRLKLATPNSNAVVMRNAPLRINLGEQELRIRKDLLRAEVLATAWDYGVLSICFQIPIPAGTTWQALIQRAAAINEDSAFDSEVENLARRKSKELEQLLLPAIQKPSEWTVSEDYVIHFLEKVSGVAKAYELVEKADIPSLILGEARDRLADKNRAGILENVYQYAEDDLAVIDWNSAIVLEPSGQRDLADVIEFAVTHLLEVRYYDDLLDRRLSELYDMIEEKRRGIFGPQFSKISQEANTRYIEFSEVMERVDNSLKVVGDFYLAVIFRAAVRRFRIMDWQSSIARKMNLFAQVSELFQGETNVLRSHILEIIIIMLILFEIVSAVLKAKA